MGFIEWRWALGETFTLAARYHHEAYFAARYPDNLDIRATLRRILRRLAANGEITPVQRGVYRR